MLRRAVHECGLLPKDVHLAAAGWMDVVAALVQKCGQVGLDLFCSGGELADQFIGYGVDLERWVSLVSSFSEFPVHAEPSAQVVGEEDVVDL